MVFFLFGSTPDTWALGNAVWTYQKGLACGGLFQDGTLAGNTISWGSLGPGGLYCFCLERNGAIICTANGALLADVKPSIPLYGPPVNPVYHLSFSPLGGWFTSYNDGRVRLSAVGAFPESFHRLAGPYLQTRNNHSLQTSVIRDVFFGYDQAVIIKLANGAVLWSNISEALATLLRQRGQEGWTLGRNTSLCQWASEGYCFIEFVRAHGWRNIHEYSYHVPESGMLSSVLVREVVEGGVPVSHTVPREHVSMQENRKSQVPAYPKPQGMLPASRNPFRALMAAGTSEASGSGATASASAPASTSTGKMTDDEYRTYKYLFAATDKEGRGYISGEQMLGLFEKSGLSRDELAKIWVRSDNDLNGRLDLDEFCTAMHLIGQQRKDKTARGY